MSRCEKLEAAVRALIALVPNQLQRDPILAMLDAPKAQERPYCKACNRVGLRHCSDPEHCGEVEEPKRCVPYWPWAEKVVCQICGGKWRGDQRPAPICPGKQEPQNPEPRMDRMMADIDALKATLTAAALLADNGETGCTVSYEIRKAAGALERLLREVQPDAPQRISRERFEEMAVAWAQAREADQSDTIMGAIKNAMRAALKAGGIEVEE